MPTLTIELPESKFKKDDVLQYKRLVLHIWRVSAEGNWDHYNGKTSLDWDGSYHYYVTVQEGFGEGRPIRPGTFLTMNEKPVGRGLSVEDAVKISWNKPIIEPDDEKNIGQRWKDWENTYPTEIVRR